MIAMCCPSNEGRAFAASATLGWMTGSSDRSPLSPTVLDALLGNRARFLSFLERRLGDRELAEELLQEAYVRSLERGGDIDDEESARAWFYRVLRNALVDRYRRGAVERRAMDSVARETTLAPDVDDALMDVVCACIGEVLGTLRDEYAEIVRAIDLEECPMSDFAASRGITSGNAAVRLHRARKALRNRVLETCGSCAEHACVDCSCRRRTPDEASPG